MIRGHSCAIFANLRPIKTEVLFDDDNKQNQFNEKLHKCRYCNVKYLSKRALCNHERLEHKEIYQKPERIKHCCSKCDLKCDSAHNLKRHFEIVHEGKKPHMCSLCGKTFLHYSWYIPL